jgi:hypothetical protein
MPKLELHPVSLVAGAALAVLAFVAMAPAPPPPSAQPIYNGLVPAVAMVQIQEGVPYVVPAGKMLVITGIGASNFACTSCASTPVLRVNGVPTCATAIGPGTGADSAGASSVSPVPIGLAIPAGAIVDVDDASPFSVTGRAWGYLDRQ